ncbi:MAG: DUF1385 domain-containing protein [Eubacteriales bacterium]
MPNNDNLSVHTTPVAEGVRIQVGSVTAFAVRQDSKDVALRLRREYHPARDAMERIPFLRGIVRLITSVADFLDGVSESAQLMPQQIVKGTRFEQRFATLFRIHPTSLVASLSILAVLFLIGGLVIAGPWALVKFVLPRYELSREAINAIACATRVLAMLLCALLVPRLRVVDRFAMYRGAINRVLNAAPGDDGLVTQQAAEKASFLSRRSDAAFILTVLILSVIAFALIRTFTLPIQLLVRVLTVLAIAAVLNEPIRALERAKATPLVNALLGPQLLLERCLTRRPHAQMVEVAVYAYNAAKENDRERD